jgi:hypothetical protein
MEEQKRSDAPPDDDAVARRQRADKLHGEIEQLKLGAPGKGGGRKRPSPREFTERSVREELEKEHELDRTDRDEGLERS